MLQSNSNGFACLDTPPHKPQSDYENEAHPNFRKAFANELPNPLVERYQYSLQPDLINGWKCRQGLYSVPINYFCAQTAVVLSALKNDPRYIIAYLARPPLSSLQMHVRFNYPWKHRHSRLTSHLKLESQNTSNKWLDRRNEEVWRMEKNKTQQNNEDVWQGNCTSGREKHNQRAEITFESEFESGNLDLAIRVKRNEYDLLLRTDSNTRGHSNWFYFRACNKQETGPVVFNICNLTKPRNLYNTGMKPFCRPNNSKQWKQSHCSDVFFGERISRYEEKIRYNLQFTYDFKQPNSSVDIAYAIPYTYTDLCFFIENIKKHSAVNVSQLCQTLGGLSVPLLTITEKNEKEKQNICDEKARNISYSNENSIDKPKVQTNDVSLNNASTKTNGQCQKKRIALITARIHPGEANSSHLLQGFIEQLLSIKYEHLLKKFIFYIVPMLNPDGVVAGNFRTSLSGKDLNRQYNNLNKIIYPQITNLSELAYGLKKVQFYFDFHGHSAKKGLFCYGPQHPITHSNYYKSRALAKLLQKSCGMFSYKQSVFSVNEQKKNTGRAHMLWKVKVNLAYTIEVSNGLYEINDGSGKLHLLNAEVLRKAGSQILLGLSAYIKMRPLLTNVKAKVDSHLKNKNKLKIKPKPQIISLLEEIKNQTNQNHYLEGGSDSEEDNEDLTSQEYDQFFKAIIDKQSQYKNNFRVKKIISKESNKESIQLENKNVNLIENVKQNDQFNEEKLKKQQKKYIKKYGSQKRIEGIKQSYGQKKIQIIGQKQINIINLCIQ